LSPPEGRATEVRASLPLAIVAGCLLARPITCRET
jgi:hypothetical protein